MARDSSFDTIVVGAGSAGVVVATRVSERSDRSVLLLDAGRDYGDAWPDDLRDGRVNSMRAHDWGYRHVATTGQVEMRLPRGRVFGGSSSVNTCIALRGTPADYDEWGALGCAGWSWDECLPSFRRLERDLDVGQPGIEAAWHGIDGPLPIKRPRPSDLSRWQAAFAEACSAAGFPECADSNAPGATGYGMHAFNRVEGERWNVARAYLTKAVRARPQLALRGETFVRRLLFDGRRCTGVEVETRGEISQLHAGRVVLCGGVFGTPGLLLRSGIGGDGPVRRVGATPLVEVPAVGARLLDHAGAALFFLPKRWGVIDYRVPVIQNVLRLRSELSGLLNDLQLQSGAYGQIGRRRPPIPTLMANIGKPRGAGTLTFEGTDPHQPPVIRSRLIEHPDDRARLVEALQLLERLSSLPPLKRLGRLIVPSRATLRNRTRLTERIQRVTGSGYHPCGTVPMGRDGDDAAATDPRGRVRGVTGLFVADASLMPTIPTANINLATIMIGEHLGAWLREEPGF